MITRPRRPTARFDPSGRRGLIESKEAAIR